MNLVEVHNLTDAPGQHATTLTLFGQKIPPGRSTKVEAARAERNRKKLERLVSSGAICFGSPPADYRRTRKSSGRNPVGTGDIGLAREEAADLYGVEEDEPEERQTEMVVERIPGGGEILVPKSPSNTETVVAAPEPISESPDFDNMALSELMELARQKGLPSGLGRKELIEALKDLEGTPVEEE